MAEGDLDQMGKVETSAGAVASDHAEEASLWETLPRELQNKVLSHLPLESLFQVRCVCKAWRNVILCRGFASMYDAMQSSDSPSPAICYITSSSPLSIAWCTYDYSQNIWKKRTSLPNRSHPRLEPEDANYSVYAVGGLLVLRLWKLGVSHWVVWNPLTNKWKTLPPCKNRTLKATSVFVYAFVSDERSRRYKILMAHNPKYKSGLWARFETSTRMVTEIYDSATGVWTQSESTLQFRLYSYDHCHYDTKIHPVGVLSNGVIYFVSKSEGNYYPEKVLFCYDIKSEQWREEVTVNSCRSIFEWDGRLMSAMMHYLDEEEEGSWSKCIVYERDLATRRWVETAIKVPARIITNDFHDIDAIDAELVAEGNHLVFAGFVRVYGSFRIAIYRKAENCWTCSPSGHFNAQVKVGDRLVQFKPRLDWTP